MDQSRIAPSWHLRPLYWRWSFTAGLSYLAAVLWVSRVLFCTPLLPTGCLQLLCNCFSILPYFIKFSLTVFCLTHFCWELCVSCSWSWLCHPICFLLPNLLFVGSICDVIQFTAVGENYQWRVSARPFPSFNNNERRNQFRLLRELQSETSETWCYSHWDWQQNSTWHGCYRSSPWALVLHVVVWNSPGVGFVPHWC